MANHITVKDLITEARSVPVFRGDGSSELSSFLSEAENIASLAIEQNSKNYIYNIFIAKLQGEAAMSIRRLPDDRNWETIKQQLIKSFGVQESYLKLKDKADGVKFSNVSQFYKELRDILDKLNLKYKLDSEKPTEFKPQNNEKSILEKFLNKINRSDSMYLRIKDVLTLEEAYYSLVETGINDHIKNDNNPGRQSNFKNRDHQNYQTRTYHNNNRYSDNNNRYNNNQNRFNQSRDEISQNSNYSNKSRYQTSNFSNRNSNPFRNNSPSSSQSQQNRQESVNSNHNVETHENFHLTPRETHYQ